MAEIDEGYSVREVPIGNRVLRKCPKCTRLLHCLHPGPSEVDEEKTGVAFIDVLFALIVGAIAAVAYGDVKTVVAAQGAFRHSDVISLLQLVVAFVVTTTSWIGYHGSQGRARYRMKFINLPLLQFTVDVFLLLAYAILVYAASGTGLALEDAEKLQIATIATIFLGYLIWDILSEWMRHTSLYGPRPGSPPLSAGKGGEDTVSYRLRVTLGAFVVLVLAALIWFATTPDFTWTIVLSILVLVVLVGYRLLQDQIGGIQDMRYFNFAYRVAQQATAVPGAPITTAPPPTNQPKE
jgi:hypothetical protein